MKGKKWYFWVLPTTLIITLCLVVPLFIVIYPSFNDGGFTINNYVGFLTDSFYLGVIVRTIKLSVITTLICILLGVPTAFYLSRLPKKAKGIALTLIMFPLLTNAVVRSFAWMTILGKNGVINSFLMAIKIIKEPIGMLYTENAIIIGSVYLFLPLMITTLMSVMEGIDNESIEAAQTLGAKSMYVFMKIILPLSFSGILIGSVLVFTGTLSAYTTPFLLGGNKNMVLATLLNQQVNQLYNWTNAGMISLIMIVISMLVMTTMRKVSIKLDKREDEYEHA